MSPTTIYQRDSYLLLADGTRWPVAGDISINSETEYVRTRLARKPDEQWTHTDSNGHAHAYVRDEEDVPRLPSLERRSVRIECDGSCFEITHGDCEGYDVDEWHCRQCDEVVEPGFVHDYDAENHGIPVQTIVSYDVTVEAQAQLSEAVVGAHYAYVDESGNEHRHALPPLHVGQVEATTGFDGTVVRSQLQGIEYKSVKRNPVGP